MGKLYMNEELFGSDDSKDIKYDNSTSQIEVDNVQGAIDYILENGTGNSSDMELTYAEYLKLSDEEKNNGTNYFIKDLNNKPKEEKEIIGSASSISYSGAESGLRAETVQAAIDSIAKDYVYKELFYSLFDAYCSWHLVGTINSYTNLGNIDISYISYQNTFPLYYKPTEVCFYYKKKIDESSFENHTVLLGYPIIEREGVFLDDHIRINLEDKFSFEAYYEDDLKKHETTIYVSIRPLSIDASAEDESITDIRFYIK